MRKWIQKVKLKKGSLYKQLGIPKGRTIPSGKLERIAHAKTGSKLKLDGYHKITPLLKKRAVLARTLRRIR